MSTLAETSPPPSAPDSPAGHLTRILAAVFAGDRRVWRVAAITAVPLLLLTGFYCLQPRSYYTGTDSVEDLTYQVRTPAHAPLCVTGLQLPARTAFVRLRVLTPTSLRPAMRLLLHVDGGSFLAKLPPASLPASRMGNADFPIPLSPEQPTAQAASLCVTSAGPVNWGGSELTKSRLLPAHVQPASLPVRPAIWYLPASGSTSSFLARAGEVFSRAALFRPGIVGAWTYPVLLFLVLPLLALLAVRLLALAALGRGRRLGLWLFALAALNACCWALITPVFQAPDEVDHFAYVQSLVERREGPSHDPASPLQRWSSAEFRALKDTSFLTDHQVGDSRPPWLASQQRQYEATISELHPPANDGGGYTTSAVHGPIYYLALSPAYLATRHGSVFSQLTLMRFSSALIGALVVLFTFLLARELAPHRQWLAVLAALLVAFEPMFGFISGAVNNDVGVNAAAAALELLLIRLVRRGITVPWGLLTGVVLVALPMVKGTGLSLYPVAGLAFAGALWRHHRRAELGGWLALVLGAVSMGELSAHALSGLQPSDAATGASAITTNTNAVEEAAHHIPDFAAYVWQVFLPRLPFMAPHFPAAAEPAYVIFIERGWAAFGWFTVFFPAWVYVVIFVVSLLMIPLGLWAARREWSWVRRHWIEVLLLIAMPTAVILGFEAAYYTPGVREGVPEFGRYVFPAIGPLAVLVVGALHAFGRRHMLSVGTGLLVAMISLSYAAQLLTLTSFYA